MDDERVLTFAKPLYYNNKVLVGNWFEKTSQYRKPRYRHSSTYNVDYTSKRSEGGGNAWMQRVRGAGLEADILFNRDEINYDKNFSSTYDLSYRHLPKALGYKVYKYKEQPPDLLENFGNATKYGYIDEKKYDWANDRLDPRRTAETHYEDTFRTYTKDQFELAQPKIAPKKERCNPITWECMPICLQ